MFAGLIAGWLLPAARPAEAFCGFYVAKADTRLFNKASKVILVRHDDKTVLTMANDYQGDPKEFAIVVPVPTFLNREQIHITDNAIIDHLDAYTSPRLVEYFDDNPCDVMKWKEDIAWDAAMPASEVAGGGGERAKSLGVTVEAEYTIGEYDIVILSAKESDGLETWLTENGYNIPEGASRVLGSYIKQKVRFFVAKVNLEEQERLGYTYLRPLQVAFESPKFMLPIRLGTVNADGPQELFVFAITRTGRVEPTNYRAVKLPSDMELPVYIKEDFANFYRDMFSAQVERHGMRTVFLEYAWDMSWCDPCAADPLSRKQLRELGAFWLPREDQASDDFSGGAVEAFVTRLHLRYTAETFPEDLFFQETGDKTNFQGRYVLRHPWTGEMDCPEAKTYREKLWERQEMEARKLAYLTGWRLEEVRQKAGLR